MTENQNTPYMNWPSPDLAGTFKLFQQKCDWYFTVRDINSEQRASHILLYVGDEGLRIFNSLSLSAADSVNPNLIWEKFTAHIEPQVNIRVQRYYLQKYIQNEEETIDTFFTRCKLQALRCKFSRAELNERLIEQLIVGTRFPGLQKELLSKNEHLTLEEALNIGRTHEASINHLAQLRGMQHNDVHAINTRKQSMVVHTVEPNMDGRQNARLMDPPAGTAGRTIIGKAYVAWATIMTKLDSGKYSDMIQSNAQRRDNGLNGDDADHQQGNGMCIQKRITPTLWYSHLMTHSKHCHLTVLTMKAVTFVTKSSRWSTSRLKTDRTYLQPWRRKLTLVRQETSCHAASSEECTRQSWTLKIFQLREHLSPATRCWLRTMVQRYNSMAQWPYLAAIVANVATHNSTCPVPRGRYSRASVVHRTQSRRDKLWSERDTQSNKLRSTHCSEEWPNWRLPWSVWRNRQLSRWIPHHHRQVRASRRPFTTPMSH